MRLDYHDKKVGRSKVERRAVQKNRPRKEPVGLFALLSVAVLIATFGGGVLTGWFFFKGSDPPPVAAVAQPAKPAEPLQPAPPPAADAPLTFYRTLPAGGQGVMGSGVNLKLPEPAPAAPRPAPAAAPSAAPAAPQPEKEQQKPAAPEKAEKAEKQEAKPEGEEGGSVRYVVQVASHRDKKEAEALQARLSAKGVAAYLVESRHPDKSVWYRVRIGRNLTKAEATRIAEKAGQGATLIAE